MDTDTFLIDDTKYITRLSNKYLKRHKYIPPDPRKVIAVIPGVIQQIYIKEGQTIKRGDNLLILEAMKMKNLVKSNQNGKIKKIYIETGQNVSKQQLLLDFE
ncbi:MAG: acetyl-CoA carboxylase biotin carboxyl carrier protein subunit [FCB group bacterium]|jgi:pyruvate carboxylase